MAWYYSFTHKRGSEDATTWQQRIRGLYPADALFAEAGGLCVVAVKACRREDSGAIRQWHDVADALTPEATKLLVKKSGRLLGNASLVWFEPWMLASLREGVAEVARSQAETSQAIDSLTAKISQTIRGTDRGSMS